MPKKKFDCNLDTALHSILSQTSFMYEQVYKVKCPMSAIVNRALREFFENHAEDMRDTERKCKHMHPWFNLDKDPWFNLDKAGVKEE